MESDSEIPNDKKEKKRRDPVLDANIEHHATWFWQLVTGIQERRQYFLDRVRERRKKRFLWWKRIVWGTALLKLLCCLIIIIVTVRFRYYTMGPLIYESWVSASSQSLVAFLFYDGLAAMISLSCFIIIFAFLIALVAELQQPQHMGIIFAITQVFIFLLIGVGCFSGGAAVNSPEISAFLFGDTIALENGLTRSRLYQFQERHECCGATEPTDWLHFIFYSFVDPATAGRWVHHNDMEWMYSCSKSISSAKEPAYCSLPPSCCTAFPNCAGYVKRKDYIDMFDAGKAGDQRKTLQLASQFHIEKSTVYNRGCLSVLTVKLDEALFQIGVMIALLCLISILLTLLFTAAILYHSSVGDIDLTNFIVSPSTGTGLVRFFMFLDGMIESDETLTDFSIIEELKQLDIDERFQEATV